MGWAGGQAGIRAAEREMLTGKESYEPSNQESERISGEKR